MSQCCVARRGVVVPGAQKDPQVLHLRAPAEDCLSALRALHTDYVYGLASEIMVRNP